VSLQKTHQLLWQSGRIAETKIAQYLNSRSAVASNFLVDSEAFLDLGSVCHAMKNEANGSAIFDALSAALCLVY
jgi:hypothetical protein